MSNLNDPQGWNIRPNGGGDGGSNKCDYALLLPLLSVAVYRWIRDKKSQREIQQVKDQYDTKIVINNLERKHQETLIENRRKEAHLKLELEKEHNQLQDCQQAVATCREKLWDTEAVDLLNELEQGLMERQTIYCSSIFRRSHRLEIEKNLLLKVAQKPLAQELNIENDLKIIFSNDWYCAGFTNTDRRKNGSLMWSYLNKWKQHVKQQKEQKRAEWSMGAVQPDQDPAGSRTT